MASDVIDEFRAPMVITVTSVSTSSTAAVQVHAGGAVGRQRLVLISDVSCYIRFGDASVSAATTSDEFLPAGQYYPLNTNNHSTYFRVIGTGAGSLYHTVEGYPG